MFVLSLVAALAGAPLRLAEAAYDMACSMSPSLAAGATLEILDGGIGDDSGANLSRRTSRTFRSRFQHALKTFQQHVTLPLGLRRVSFNAEQTDWRDLPLAFRIDWHSYNASAAEFGETRPSVVLRR